MSDYNKYIKYGKLKNSNIALSLRSVYFYINNYKCDEVSKENIYNLFDKFYIEKSQRGKMFKDIKKEYFKYRTYPYDYLAYGFYNLNQKARREIIVESFISMCYDWAYFNDINYSDNFNDKFLFSQVFSDYYNRDVLSVGDGTSYEDFFAFCKKYQSVFVKPRFSLLGRGVFVADTENEEKIKNLFDELITSGEYIVEEIMENEESLKEFHPYSLNTIRMNTILTKDGPEILTAYLNLGNNQKIIDNYHTGAVGAAVDIDTGVVMTCGYDEFNNKYIYHPYSGKKIPGYELKNWVQCKEMVLNLAKRVPQIRLIGWDISIDKNGKWFPVEGNDNCGFAKYQVAMNIGLQKRLDEIIKNE